MRTGSPLPIAGLVAHRGDALDPLVLDQLADLLGQAIARLLVGHFLDDDLIAAALLDDLGPRPQDDLAAAGAVAVDDSLPAHDDAAGREIGTGNDLHQFEKTDDRDCR